ncbi:MAG: hypothetical protein AAFY71_08750 [Bacteroidota bacterium]
MAASSSEISELILVSFHFPPSNGIGARRWAKLSKYLAKQGIKVHVITTPPANPSEKSTWTTDVENELIHIHYVPSGYPDIQPSSHPVGKVFNRLRLFSLEKRTKGTPYDKAVFWQKGLTKTALDLIKKYKIRHVIATGAPFHALSHTIDLKKHVPNLKVLVDFRDPWTNAVNYGMQEISSKRKSYEVSLEKKVLELSDVLVGPTHPELLLGPSFKRASITGIVEELPHFYDPEDLPQLEKEGQDQDKIKIVYGGAIYMDLEETLDKLDLALTAIKENHLDFYRRLEWKIFTPHLSKLEKIASHHADIFFPQAPIGKEELFEKMADADMLLILLAEHNKHFRTTKFFEYLTIRKPLLMFGPEGRVSHNIQSEKLGVSIEKESLNGKILLENLKRLKEDSFVPNEELIETYSVEKVSSDLIALLQKVS